MQQETVLVVDDEPHIALSIERSLRDIYQIRVAHSGVEALKIIRRSQPDLIILDVMMPGMSGLQFCQEVRQDPILRTTPILFLTANVNMEDKLAGFEAGADDYLTKPFEIRELQFRVAAILRRTKPVEQSPQVADQLIVGDLKLNCKAFTLNTKEKDILLTPIEFDLIYHLMSHADQIFSGEQLLRELWDYPSDTGSTDLVRMHIRNLRRKIEPNPAKPSYILTVPRHGYTIAND